MLKSCDKCGTVFDHDKLKTKDNYRGCIREIKYWCPVCKEWHDYYTLTDIDIKDIV